MFLFERMISGFGAQQRAQTAAATGSVSKLASRNGLGFFGTQNRIGNGGPPRVMGSQEVTEKKLYAQKWNNALITEAIDAAISTKERIASLSPQTLERFVPFFFLSLSFFFFFIIFYVC